MKKRILSLFLAFVMAVGLLPMSAFATGGTEDTVYLSVSYDGTYIEDEYGSAMAYVPVKLSNLASIDLADYDLSDYLYDADGDGTYEITALHLMIYAHEMLCGGDWSDVNFTGAPGSSYFAGGVFGFDENLNYYLNGQYPLAGEGWGATSDQIVLEAGDYLDVASFSSWDFYMDSNYGFHFFADSNGDFTHHYTVEAGSTLSVQLVRSFSAMGSETVVYEESRYPVSYGSDLYDTAAQTVTTDDDGCAAVTFAEAGTYYLWADGGYGNEYPTSIVSSPAYAKVTVTAGTEEPAPEPETYTVTLPTETVGYTVTAAEDSVSPVAAGGSYSFTVTIAEGFEAGENFAVKANDTLLTARMAFIPLKPSWQTRESPWRAWSKRHRNPPSPGRRSWTRPRTI